MTMTTGPGASCPTTRREVVQRLAGVTSVGVITAGFAFGPAAPAVAQDTLAATKTSYFRYVPRIVVSGGKGGGEGGGLTLAICFDSCVTCFHFCASFAIVTETTEFRVGFLHQCGNQNLA